MLERLCVSMSLCFLRHPLVGAKNYQPGSFSLENTCCLVGYVFDCILLKTLVVHCRQLRDDALGLGVRSRPENRGSYVLKVE